MTRVFISHSTQDRDLVEREIIAPLRASGIETWYSKDDIQTAAAWERSIKEALNQCDWFLVALTPRSVSSEWVQTEVHWALERRQNRVVPVLLEDCAPEELHLKMLRIQHLDFRQRTEETRAKLLAIWADASTHPPAVDRGPVANPSHQSSVPSAASGTIQDTLARTRRYTMIRALGQSPKGVVVQATDTKLGMEVAIRVVSTAGWSPKGREKLLADSRAAIRLAHPAVARVFDVVESDDDVLIVMEYVGNARPLAEIMWSGVTPERAAELLSQVASGLHYLHARGFIHGWLRPSTVLVNDRGPHLTDLGIELAAQQLGSGSGAVGSPTYSAPELLAGEITSGRADIYSLGVIFYEMLTGRRPFEGANMSDIMMKALSERPTPPREIDRGIPQELERICLKCLSLRTAERYATAADLSQDLKTWKEREKKKRIWPFG